MIDESSIVNDHLIQTSYCGGYEVIEADADGNFFGQPVVYYGDTYDECAQWALNQSSENALGNSSYDDDDDDLLEMDAKDLERRWQEEEREQREWEESEPSWFSFDFSIGF